MARRRYDQRFMARAAGLVRETGKPIAKVASDLGIPHSTLRNWVALNEQRRSAAQPEGEEQVRPGVPSSTPPLHEIQATSKAVR